jgi:hypothetical protein
VKADTESLREELGIISKPIVSLEDGQSNLIRRRMYLKAQKKKKKKKKRKKKRNSDCQGLPIYSVEN